MIREHGDVVEADLAFRGIDLRDLYRHGSGLTPRRLLVLIHALLRDPNALLGPALDRAHEKSLTSADRIRERQKLYEGGR